MINGKVITVQPVSTSSQGMELVLVEVFIVGS